MLQDHNYTESEREHIEELSSSYVLGSLTEDDAGLEEFETLVESGDPLLSKTLEQMLGASVALAMAAPSVEPPASLRASLLENITNVKQSAGGSEQDPVNDQKKPIPSQDAIRLKRRTRYFIGTSIFSGLLLCVLVAMNVSKSAMLDRSNDLMKALLKQTDSLRQITESTVDHPNDSTQPAPAAVANDNSNLHRFLKMFGENDSRLVTLASSPMGTTRQHLFFSPGQRTVALLRENLRPLEGNKTYELWATVGNKAPVAIGTFRIDPKSTPSVLNFSTKLKTASSFAISIEPGSGGSVRKGTVIFTGDVPKAGLN